MATIQDNINRIKQAKADIKEAIIAKGVEVADDVRIDGYAEKIGEIKQGGGGSQFAIDYGEEIYTNNAYSMTAEQEDIDYYNQIQAERAAYAAGTGGRSDAEIQADPEFRRKIAWWPKGMKYPAHFNYYVNLKELNAPTLKSNYYTGHYVGCASLEFVRALPNNTRMFQMFKNCCNLKGFEMDLSAIQYAVSCFWGVGAKFPNREIALVMPELTDAGSLFNSSMFLKITLDAPKVTTITSILTNSTVEEIWMDVSNCTNVATYFQTFSLKRPYISGWKMGNFSLNNTIVEPVCIHYILEHAIGAVERKLTIGSTQKTNWEASEYYEEDVARAQELNITIA